MKSAIEHLTHEARLMLIEEYLDGKRDHLHLSGHMVRLLLASQVRYYVEEMKLRTR